MTVNSHKPFRVVLVSMPWAALNVPSLALGILSARLRDAVPEAAVDSLYVNIDCAEWLTAVLADARLADYEFFASDSYFLGCGDWAFSSALYGDPAWRVEEFADQIGPRLSDRELEVCHRIHARAPEFIAQQADELLRMQPDLVCFTTTFQQNVASLALARRLKELDPGIRIVMGGANCDGDQGKAVHEAFDFVDFIVRGEGELAFPALVRGLLEEGDLSGIPGLCWRTDTSAGVNPMTDLLLPPAQIPMPDYDAYFARLARMPAAVRSWFEPQLVIESARGCWWGEKHHCTFCGLNGSAMTFRSKPAEVFTGELEQLARRHKILDFYAVDNILDMAYLETAVRSLADGVNDYRIMYEIKSNMKFAQLQRLRDAGIATVQPGVESLSTAVLKIMDKGVTGTQNVRFLRDAESLGVSVIWNYLCGFPGERDEHYTTIIEQFPALHHLEPPGATLRISLERFSPYFNRPELGIHARGPDRQYSIIYDLPERQLYDLAYLFDYEPCGIDRQQAQLLGEHIDRWRTRHAGSTLTYRDLGEHIELENTRPGFDWQTVDLIAPEAAQLFRELDQPRTVGSLRRSLSASHIVPEDHCEQTVRALLDEWTDLGLLFTDDGRYVHVATSADNQWLCRLGRQAPERFESDTQGEWFARRFRRSISDKVAT